MKDFKLSKNEIKPIINKKGSCIASDKITVDGQKIGYMYRENFSNESDSGWRFFTGNEDEIYLNNSDNFSIFDLNTICNYDESIIPYLDMQIGIKLQKVGEEFSVVDK